LFVSFFSLQIVLCAIFPILVPFIKFALEKDKGGEDDSGQGDETVYSDSANLASPGRTPQKGNHQNQVKPWAE
jgi:hypothetical protein